MFFPNIGKGDSKSRIDAREFADRITAYDLSLTDRSRLNAMCKLRLAYTGY